MAKSQYEIYLRKLMDKLILVQFDSPEWYLTSEGQELVTEIKIWLSDKALKRKGD